MSLLRSAIGTVLRRLRHQQGRTLQDVADAAGVSLPYLSEIERGRKEASSEILAAICGALGVALTELLDQVLAELLRTSPPTAPVRAPRMRVTCGAAGVGAGLPRRTRTLLRHGAGRCRTGVRAVASGPHVEAIRPASGDQAGVEVIRAG